MDDNNSFERKPGMDNRVFPGPTLASLSGDGVSAMARRRRRRGPLRWPRRPRWPPDRPHGHRLHHRDEFRQRIPADGRPKLQERACHRRQLVGVALQSKCRGGSLLDLSSNSHFPVIIDSMMTLGPLQWGASNGGSSAWAGIAATHAQTVTTNLVRSDGSTFRGRRFQPDDRGATEPGDIRRLFR